MSQQDPPQQPPFGEKNNPTMAQKAKGAAGAADANLQKTLDSNKFVAGTESFADGIFAKMGLQPTNAFCCCAPRMCGLRTVVLILSVLQAVYGGCFLVVAVFTSLWVLIVSIASLQLLGIILNIFCFAFQLIIGALYLATGIYGIKATASLDKVMALNPEVVRATGSCYKLNLLAFVCAVILGLITAIFQSMLLSSVLSIIFYWIWFLAYCALAAYVLYAVWSYAHWITAAVTGGAEPLSRAVKFSNQTSAPPPQAQPVGA